MPTTEQFVQQVKRHSCDKMMGAESLTYTHSKYCINRVVAEQPEVILIPNTQVNHDKNNRYQQLYLYKV
jgi:hypothetical protein